MKNQKIIGVIVIGLVIAGLSFFGGMKYANSKNPASQFANRAQNGLNQNGGTRGGMRGINGGGFVSGQILSMDSKSMTIKLNSGGPASTQGGSKIVFYSPTTKVEKTVDSAITDVVVGNQVTIVGTANSDGSVNATSVQLRPTQVNDTTPIKQ